MRGLHHDKSGYKNEAMKDFNVSASYGNANAKYFMGLMYLQKEDYINAHAWLSLLESDYIRADKIKGLLPRIEANLTEVQFKQAQHLLNELKQDYGDYAGLLKREQWRKSLSYSGTRIKGHIPHSLTIYANNYVITGQNLRYQVKTFVDDYNEQFKYGEVKLNDVEYVETPM